jgi:hypothetical protein
MAKNMIIPENGVAPRAFHHGSRSVAVGLPEDTGKEDAMLENDLKLPPEGHGMSRPRLRLACYQASSADFRWTMSQDELRWYAWRIAMSGLLRLQDGLVETMFRPDMDAIVIFSSGHHLASLDCQAKDRPVGSFMHFKDSSDDLDPKWVRCVCRS